jgi:hypothetical protein
MGGVGGGRMGLGVDSSHNRGCKRLRPFVRAQMLRAQMHGNGLRRVGHGSDMWDWVQNPGTNAWDARILHAHGAVGANSGSASGWKVICAQPLRSEHVSRRGRV